ncbi:A/G-specific adenine glycosylase [Lyngbya confervoides]|uniref:Adenine DNA glycosylase n=1 Tax=Lyngbya confervoides BDU141951 TaxID=1574623 RepID=A0ABD4T202_9CYAN|nr:A/G-specific adenine glycosylase [Lyngbya confervoides]MCM1982757.1 A/G-specific adenine glycosylase [Lyngbya confervoides BDU141951]
MLNPCQNSQKIPASQSSYPCVSRPIDPCEHQEYRRTLLIWYGRNGRTLPWRQTQDPYAIWISEIMLQQTQVKTVLPYYQTWIRRFPTVQSLAQANLQTVLKAWEGLGYYARARHLHRAAQVICDRFQGQVPLTTSDLESLPGIGRTTAGGIASAAYNQPAAILDGNVKRVLARVVGLKVPPSRALKDLWSLSEDLLDPEHPRDFNQALMDLGATVCTPRRPDCHRCPWVELCFASMHQQQADLPMTEERTPLPHKHIGVAVIWNPQGQILIDRRPAAGLLGGLWEFPGGKIEAQESVEACIAREIQEEIGIEVAVGDHLITVDHAYTHFKVRLIVHHCTYLKGDPQPVACDEIRWVFPDQLEDYPFPKANQQIIAALKAA